MQTTPFEPLLGASATARIDVMNFKIDRVRPSIMDPYMQDYEWNKFCDDIDEAMLPMLRSRHSSILVFLLTVVFILIGLSTTDIIDIPMGMTMLIPMSMVFCFVCVAFCQYRQTNQISTEVTRICKEASDLQPRLSFVTTKYIEVMVNGTVDAVQPTAYLVNEDTYMGETGQTPQERLANLEKIRNVISREEYDQKRSDILASV